MKVSNETINRVNKYLEGEGITYTSVGVLCGPCEVCNQDYDYSESEPPDEQPPTEGYFSNSTCETCGSISGTRYPAHGRDSDDNIIHFEVCEDCIILIS